MTKQEKAYAEYIENHVVDVKKAYELIGKQLQNTLHVDEFELVKRVNTHDVSKWSKEEFDAYRQHFYPEDGEQDDKEAWENAWEHHYLNNDHHPEHYEFFSSNTLCFKKVVYPMPKEAIAEMILDWVAMSLNFKTSLKDWYKNAHLDLHEDTKKIVDAVMNQKWVVNIHLK